MQATHFQNSPNMLLNDTLKPKNILIYLLIEAMLVPCMTWNATVTLIHES